MNQMLVRAQVSCAHHRPQRTTLADEMAVVCCAVGCATVAWGHRIKSRNGRGSERLRTRLKIYKSAPFHLPRFFRGPPRAGRARRRPARGPSQAVCRLTPSPAPLVPASPTPAPDRTESVSAGFSTTVHEGLGGSRAQLPLEWMGGRHELYHELYARLRSSAGCKPHSKCSKLHHPCLGEEEVVCQN